MANHFRSSERQDSVDQTPQDAGVQDSSQVAQDRISDEELEAAMADLRNSAAAHMAASVGDDAPEATDNGFDDVPAAQDLDVQVPVMPTDQVPAEPDVQQADPVQPEPEPEPADAPSPNAISVADEDQTPAPAQPGFTSVFAPLQSSEELSVDRTGTPTISLRNATLIYPAQPNKPALEDVSLDIYPGEFVFVVGHSGSGKSTFLKLLTRELKATSGKVIVAGQDLTKLRNRKVPYLRRQIGTVYQDFKLLPDKTVYENVAFALECIGKPRSVIKAQVPEVLRLVGLSEKMDNYPDQLSGGEQQRVSVARAMVNRPPLLVCDEPTGNLDPAISLGIMKLLDRINRTGTTVVMATHDREMVDSMRKRVIALEAGHVVRDQERGGYGYYGAL